MNPLPLDHFAARSVGLTLAEFARNERRPPPGRVRRPPRARHRTRLSVAVGTAALTAVPSVVIVAQLVR